MCLNETHGWEMQSGMLHLSSLIVLSLWETQEAAV